VRDARLLVAVVAALLLLVSACAGEGVEGEASAEESTELDGEDADGADQIGEDHPDDTVDRDELGTGGHHRRTRSHAMTTPASTRTPR